MQKSDCVMAWLGNTNSSFNFKYRKVWLLSTYAYIFQRNILLNLPYLLSACENWPLMLVILVCTHTDYVLLLSIDLPVIVDHLTGNSVPIGRGANLTCKAHDDTSVHRSSHYHNSSYQSVDKC